MWPVWLRIKHRFLRRAVGICLAVKHNSLGGASCMWINTDRFKMPHVSYFPMKHDEWKLMSICQPSFARIEEKGHFRLDFSGFPDVFFHVYLCCFNKKTTKRENKFTFRTGLACYRGFTALRFYSLGFQETTKLSHLILIACVSKISCQQNDQVIVYL